MHRWTNCFAARFACYDIAQCYELVQQDVAHWQVYSVPARSNLCCCVFAIHTDMVCPMAFALLPPWIELEPG